MKNKYYEKFSDFKEAVLGFFENLDRHEEKLQSLLTQKYHVLHAA